MWRCQNSLPVTSSGKPPSYPPSEPYGVGRCRVTKPVWGVVCAVDDRMCRGWAAWVVTDRVTTATFISPAGRRPRLLLVDSVLPGRQWRRADQQGDPPRVMRTDSRPVTRVRTANDSQSTPHTTSTLPDFSCFVVRSSTAHRHRLSPNSYIFC